MVEKVCRFVCSAQAHVVHWQAVEREAEHSNPKCIFLYIPISSPNIIH